MTVQAGTNSVTYTGDGIQTVFNFTFRVDDVNWLSVDFLDDFDQFILNVDQEASPGGTANYLVAPPDQQDLTILRGTPQSQLLDYTRYDAFDSDSHEGALDRIVMMIQDLTGQVTAIQSLPIGTIEGQLLRWNNTTKLYEVAPGAAIGTAGQLLVAGTDPNLLLLQDNVNIGVLAQAYIEFLDQPGVVQGRFGVLDATDADITIESAIGKLYLKTPETGGVKRQIGYNVMAPQLEDGAYTFDDAGNGSLILNEDADAETWTIDQDAAVDDGALYGMSNEGAGDITLLVGTGVTAVHIGDDGTRTTKTATESWTLQTGFLGSLWKRSSTEFWWWGTGNITA